MLNKENPFQLPASAAVSFYFYPSLEPAQNGLKTKIPGAFAPRLLTCSGGRIIFMILLGVTAQRKIPVSLLRRLSVFFIVNPYKSELLTDCQ